MVRSKQGKSLAILKFPVKGLAVLVLADLELQMADGEGSFRDFEGSGRK